MKNWLFSLFGFTALLSTQAFADDAPAAATGREGNMWQTLIMIGVALVFFYFILWRPEQKRRKSMENLRSSMKKGDKVTAMGIVGTIAKVSTETNTVILKMYDGSEIEVLKAAISEVKPSGEAVDPAVQKNA